MKTRLAVLLAAAFVAGSCTLAIAQGAGGAPAAPKADSTPGGPSNAMKSRSQHMMGGKMSRHHMKKRHMMRHHMMRHKKKKKMHRM